MHSKGKTFEESKWQNKKVRHVKKIAVKGNNNNNKPGKNSKASIILQIVKLYRVNVRLVDGNMGASWS